MKENKIEILIKRISVTRKNKGLSYENMADELSLTPAAYRKIEIGETKLTVERLFQISGILDASLSELLEIDSDLFQQTENEIKYRQKIDNLYQENKAISQNLIEGMKDKISHYVSEIEFLRDLVKQPGAVPIGA